MGSRAEPGKATQREFALEEEEAARPGPSVEGSNELAEKLPKWCHRAACTRQSINDWGRPKRGAGVWLHLPETDDTTKNAQASGRRQPPFDAWFLPDKSNFQSNSVAPRDCDTAPWQEQRSGEPVALRQCGISRNHLQDPSHCISTFVLPGPYAQLQLPRLRSAQSAGLHP